MGKSGRKFWWWAAAPIVEICERAVVVRVYRRRKPGEPVQWGNEIESAWALTEGSAKRRGMHASTPAHSRLRHTQLHHNNSNGRSNTKHNPQPVRTIQSIHYIKSHIMIKIKTFLQRKP
jgi:hypothetical protein